MGQAGPWGATLVRFLFGLPFSVGLAGIALALTPGSHPRFTLAYWLASAIASCLILLIPSWRPW